MNHTTDRDGSVVTAGCVVRLLSVDSHLLHSLPSDERDQVLSMVGGEIMIDEVNEHGYATVEKVWNTGPGESTSHSIALAPSEMLLIHRVA